jgi:hypothetical protein
VGPRAGLDAMVKRKNPLSLAGKRIPGFQPKECFVIYEKLYALKLFFIFRNISVEVSSKQILLTTLQTVNMSSYSHWLQVVQGCIQKFPDRVDNETNAYL